MILLTGATGAIGSRLLPRLLASGHDVRCLVREPRRLGTHRMDVQISLGDLRELWDPYRLRQAMRGVDTVVHLAAAIRDQPPYRVEELNGLASVRLLRAAEAAGVDRFCFFTALNASAVQRTRFFRAKALAEAAVRSSGLETTVLAPSIVYDRGDSWIELLRRLSLLPALPVSGSGQSAFQPVWADDVARAVVNGLQLPARQDRHELAGPETLTYDEIAGLVARLGGRRRRLLHLPLPLVHHGLNAVQSIFRESAFATWQEAELMEVGMTAERGTADLEKLEVQPARMADVLSG